MQRFFMLVVLLLAMTSAGAVININTASMQQLQTLPHIGAVKAQAIVDYRNTYGSFHSTKDIMRVKGIGKATYEKLQNDISVGDELINPAVSVSKHRRASPATAAR